MGAAPARTAGWGSPGPMVTTENKSSYRYGLERTRLVGAQEKEGQQLNKLVSSGLRDPCAWRGMGDRSRFAQSVPCHEMPRTCCLGSAAGAGDGKSI